jgi:class 3 adenylate cyclase
MTATPRDLCILVADIPGSAKLYERLGKREASRAIGRCLNRMERVVSAHKGHVVPNPGDQLRAQFDSSEAALQAACEMQQRIHGLPPVSGVALAIRIGFHVGPGEETDGDLKGVAADLATALAANAKPGQVLTTAAAVAALPEPLQGLTKAVGALNIEACSEPALVFEVSWDYGHAELASTPAPEIESVRATKEVRLRLKHGEQKMILGPHRPAVTLGRDNTSDIVIKDARASRSHGCIERRHGQYVLIDQSTNGTYVTFRGEGEFALKREETILRGRGHITFGHASGELVGEQVEFELLD